ncbi:hypothetical protein [Demequina phytophila]|uniref:hypothetical protein n=1 Tax=Demequina phytophila TaxID=1638981 RepID=UPI0012E0697D|nr:hypothetical protein [Demequina phytophila]
MTADLTRPAAADSGAAECASPSGTGTGTGCVADLAPGERASSAFVPGVELDVPGGWTIDTDTLDSFVVRFTDGTAMVDSARPAVGVHRDARAVVDGCVETVEARAGGADELRAAIHHNSGVRVVRERRVALGGLAGWLVDVAPAEEWPGACAWSSAAPAVAVLAFGAGAQPTRYAAPGRGLRLYLLDWGGGNVVVELLGAAGGESSGDLARATQRMVDALRFEDPR